MVHEQNNENNHIPEEGEGYVDARKHEEDEIVDGAKIETHKLAAGLEASDSVSTLNALAFLDGPDASGPREAPHDKNSLFGAPLNTDEYSHFGQKILARWGNDGIANIPVAGASFILATTGATVDVARHIPGDLLAFALHPVRVYKESKAIWGNGMDSEETGML